MTSTRKLWALWFLLVFGIFNVYGPSLSSYKQSGDPSGIGVQEIAGRMTPLQFWGVLLRSDSDTARYYSYAEAMLGRPYASFYVRPMEGWSKAGPDVADPAARAWPKITPDHKLLPWRDFSMEYAASMAISP